MDGRSDTGAQTGPTPYASVLEGWAGLGAIGLFAVLSVLGAFLGADRAKAMFTSAPLALFWVLLAGLVAARLLRFARLVRLPGLLPLYLGPLLILFGSMYGSATGHSVAGRLFGSKEIPRGYMVIPEGATSDELLDRDLSRRIGRLPFGLRLKDFRIEYYEPRRKGWDLVVVVPGAPLQKRIEWEVGREVSVPDTDVRLRVLNYLDSAWPVVAEGDGPVLEVTDAGGATFVIPAEAGRQVALQEPKVTVRVRQAPSPMSGAMSAPGGPYASVIIVEIEDEQGAKEMRFVATSDGVDDGSSGAVRLRYVWPKPIGARSDPASGAPAMEVMLFRNGRQMRQWLIAGTGGPHAWLSLAPLAGPQETERQGAADGAPVLGLVRPRLEVRDYKSDVEVLEDGKTVAGKVIEVNYPLHYGGYYFYQYAYDRQSERYTVLMATSDSGLRLVYVGFGLLWVGVVWWCWAVPAWRSRARRGGEHGH